MGQTTKIILSIMATSLIVGGSTYYLTNLSTKKEKNNLEARISKLQTQVEELQQEKTESSNLRKYTDQKEGISFEYPKNWGEVNKEVFTPSETQKEIGMSEHINYSFSNIQRNEKYSNYKEISLFDKNDYSSASSLAKDAYNFLKSVYRKKSLKDLTAPDREPHLFGAMSAEKSKMTYLSSNSNKIRGVYFFMNDTDSPDVGLSLTAALLNKKGHIAEVSISLWSNKQEELDNELDQLNKQWEETGNYSGIDVWRQKMDNLLKHESFEIFEEEINQVKNLVGSLSY